MSHRIMLSRMLSPLLSLAVCVLLFLPWGYAQIGGQVRMGEDFSNPIQVEGSYPRGVADALNNFSNEIDGFQEQCEIFGLAVMAVLIFMAVLELIYAVCMAAGAELGHAMGITAEIPVLLVTGAAVLLGLVCRNQTFSMTEHFQLVVDIHLGVVPFLIILIEILGKQIVPRWAGGGTKTP